MIKIDMASSKKVIDPIQTLTLPSQSKDENNDDASETISTTPTFNYDHKAIAARLKTDLSTLTADLDAANAAVAEAIRLQNNPDLLSIYPPQHQPVVEEFVPIPVEEMKRLAKIARTFSEGNVDGNKNGQWRLPPEYSRQRPKSNTTRGRPPLWTPKKDFTNQWKSASPKSGTAARHAMGRKSSNSNHRSTTPTRKKQQPVQTVNGNEQLVPTNPSALRKQPSASAVVSHGARQHGTRTTETKEHNVAIKNMQRQPSTSKELPVTPSIRLRAGSSSNTTRTSGTATAVSSSIRNFTDSFRTLQSSKFGIPRSRDTSTSVAPSAVHMTRSAGVSRIQSLKVIPSIKSKIIAEQMGNTATTSAVRVTPSTVTKMSQTISTGPITSAAKVVVGKFTPKFKPTNEPKLKVASSKIKKGTGSATRKKKKAKGKKKSKGIREYVNPFALFPVLSQDYFYPAFKFSNQTIASYLGPNFYSIGQNPMYFEDSAPTQPSTDVPSTSRPKRSVKKASAKPKPEDRIYYHYPPAQYQEDGTPKPIQLSQLIPLRVAGSKRPALYVAPYVEDPTDNPELLNLTQQVSQPPVMKKQFVWPKPLKQTKTLSKNNGNNSNSPGLPLVQLQKITTIASPRLRPPIWLQPTIPRSKSQPTPFTSPKPLMPRPLPLLATGQLEPSIRFQLPTIARPSMSQLKTKIQNPPNFPIPIKLPNLTPKITQSQLVSTMRSKTGIMVSKPTALPTPTVEIEPTRPKSILKIQKNAKDLARK